ncbi:hypothetical protein OQY15_16205 [Pedobacter sp. MC2016-15]|uniref:pirin family protein n=1 Tax=Pedobacter sp. MC2016-15 TaxID=2994473 RepID=UPI0022456DCF|nr:hypothetical protein [Pedobacter sp. MC2016-15]MCX2480649.1 hypothetical protein [Pedobacter sp. MC2016-15]
MTTLPARIFLAEQLGRRFFAGETDSFGPLQSLRNEFLAAKDEINLEAPADSTMILIPVTGDLIYKDNRDNMEKELMVGQVATISSASSLNITIANPYDEEGINFIILSLAHQLSPEDYLFNIVDFELSESNGSMLKIMSSNIAHLWMGMFQGRHETTHHLTGKRCFYYVLSGAFEVQERLLHANDGLALWDITETEMEALSNNAVLLALELPYI